MPPAKSAASRKGGAKKRPASSRRAPAKVLVLFGTRPEVIKLAPVIRALEARPELVVRNATSAQHVELLYPLIRLFGLKLHHDLKVMAPGQTLSQVCARVLTHLDPVLEKEKPDLLLVQGDTTTAMAGALAAFHRGIPVGHVEAGLRSGSLFSPFPEEMNRRVTSRIASLHFAPTSENRKALRAEGVPAADIFVTGNPVVDAILEVTRHGKASPRIRALLKRTEGLKRLVLTTHRRESFGETMRRQLETLRDFTLRHPDVVLLFPVHPNPNVRGPAEKILGGRPRIELLDPLDYHDFIALLSASWAIVSDSGGVQEEAPTLGKPVLVLRENTERPEAEAAGVARLVGGSPVRLGRMLEELMRPGSWAEGVRRRKKNPFGRGDAGKRIAEIVVRRLRGR